MAEYQNIELIFKVNAGNLSLQKQSDDGSRNDVSLNKLTEHFLLATCKAYFLPSGISFAAQDGDPVVLHNVILGDGKKMGEEIVDLNLALSSIGAQAYKDGDRLENNVRTSRIIVKANMGTLAAAL